MNRYAILSLFVFSPLYSWHACAEESVPVRTRLAQLAEEYQFEIVGSENLGSELVLKIENHQNAEFALVRALSRYNHVIHYDGQRVQRVLILGRNGRDVGPMPEMQEAEVAP